MSRNGIFGLLAGLGLACVPPAASAETVPPIVEAAPAPVIPDAAQRESLTGCCRMHYTVAADGSVTDIRSECTGGIFTDAAVDAIQSMRFSPAKRDGQPVAAPDQTRIVAFEQPGEEGMCQAGDETWQDLSWAAEEGFPFLTMNTFTMEPYKDEEEKAEGIAQGWAEYYTHVDFDTPCGEPPGYDPPVPEASAIDTMDWDRLRRTGAAFEKMFAWMNCRSDMLDAYRDVAADWHAQYDTAPKDRIEYWAGGVIDRLLGYEREDYAFAHKVMMAYGSQILRREQALRDRDAAEAAAAASEEQEVYDDTYEAVPHYRRPREREPQWTAADQFFYERGPEPHRECLANAFSYAAQQQCLTDWYGGG